MPTVYELNGIMEGIPEKEDLLLVDALLFAVYGWTPDKIKNMGIKSLVVWSNYAKKRMTWGDAYKMRSM